MQYIHTRSCEEPVQVGYGVYRGIPYQEGYGVYQGQVFQRGHGLGGVLGSLMKATIQPAFAKAKSMVIPALKRVGKAAAKRATHQVMKTGMDVALGKKDVKQAFKTGVTDLAKATVNDAIKEMTNIIPGIIHQQQQQQPQSRAAARPAKKARKRKKTSRGHIAKKRGRHTIFD